MWSSGDALSRLSKLVRCVCLSCGRSAGVDAAYDYEMATGLKKGVVIAGDGRVHADGARTADAGTTSHGATGSVNIRAGTAESGAGGSVRVVLDEANAADVGGSTNMGGSTTGSSTNDVTSTH